MAISSLVRQQAHRFFPATNADDVITSLDITELPLGFVNADRVHLAILLLSRGDMHQFRIALSQAKQDWRDTLVAAELADEDWPAVLRQEGIEICPEK